MDVQGSEHHLRPVVVARVRPMLPKEAATSATPVVRVVPSQGLVEINEPVTDHADLIVKPKAVKCTHAFDGSASNEEVYAKFRHMVDVLLDR